MNSDWQEAIDLILKPRPGGYSTSSHLRTCTYMYAPPMHKCCGLPFPLCVCVCPSPLPTSEREDVAAARRYYHDTRDAAGALSQMPRRRSLEATLLQGLVNVGHRNDLLGALNHVRIMSDGCNLVFLVVLCVIVCVFSFVRLRPK